MEAAGKVFTNDMKKKVKKNYFTVLQNIRFQDWYTFTFLHFEAITLQTVFRMLQLLVQATQLVHYAFYIWCLETRSH